MGEIGWYIVGFIGGLIAMYISYKKIWLADNVYGTIDIDHDNNLVRVSVDANEIAKTNKKEVILKVDHNAVISREEHTL